jgi:hypothetical protein
MSSNPITGGWLRKELSHRFACPKGGQAAQARVVQDVRTGQWKQVVSCSLTDLEHEDCGIECARLANLGLMVPGLPDA